MKTKSVLILAGLLILAWVFLFQGAQTASSSPLLRITLTPSLAPTVTVVTLPPPPVPTNPPLIPVSGSDKSSDGGWLIIGGVLLLTAGVVSLALPRKRQS